MSRRPGRPTIRSSRPHMQWRTPLYAVILPIGGRPSPAAILLRIFPPHAICVFGAPFPLLGAGFFFSPQRRMLPVEYLPLGVTLIAPKHGGRTHGAIFALCALLIAGPTLARALTGAGTLDSDVWFLRPRDRPQRHPPHQPVLHLARTGHRRPAMAP